jgi:hypothetical protein
VELSPKAEINKMKKLAQKYSEKFISRKVKQPQPALALAFEAGWQAKAELVNKVPKRDMCYTCSIAHGARPPRGGLKGITACEGKCPSCKEETSIIPQCDFHWPKLGKHAIWD